MNRKTDLKFKHLKNEYIFPMKEIHSYKIEEIKEAIEHDVIYGLYASNMFLRFIYLLTQSDSNSETILIILCRSARHSSFISKYLVEIGILGVLMDVFLSVPVPFTNNSGKDAKLALLSVKLILLLSVPKRDVCLIIAKSDISDLLAKFLVIQPHHESILGILNTIKEEIFNLYSVFTLYGINAHIFDDIRQVLIINLTTDAVMKSWSSFSALTRYITNVLKMYRFEMRVGSQNDAIRPFISQVIETLSNISLENKVDNGVLLILKDGWSFIAEYVRVLDPASASSLIAFAERKLFTNSHTWIKSKEIVMRKEKDISSAMYHYGYWNINTLKLAKDLVSASVYTSTLSSYLEIMFQFGLRSKNPMARLVEFITSSKMIQIICDITIESNNNEKSRLRLCTIGSSTLIQTWSRIIKNIESHYLTQEITVLLYTTSLWLISALNPGEEIALKSHLDYILNADIQSKVFSLTSTSTKLSSTSSPNPDTNARTHLREIYNMNAFNTQTLTYSQSLHTITQKSLLIELKPLINLPMQSDWLFLPLSVISDELKLNPKSTGARIIITEKSVSETKIESLEVESNNGDIVSTLLRFLVRLDKLKCIGSAEIMYVQLAQIYLLSPLRVDKEEEIFRLNNVKVELDYLMHGAVKEIMNGERRGGLKESVRKIEDAAGGQLKFYQLYRDLVHQYAAVSFGDSSFGKVLLVPLNRTFNVDYRKLFFGELVDVLKGFKHTLSDIGECDIEENDVEMRMMYEGLIAEKKITLEHPYLMHFAMKKQLKRFE